ncbi:MAG TPA: carbamoyltransferase C-terminal domain-containing protein, partial [Ktedonobacteraceae bacterium]|nr:carbamoyltransferase C-terminal domain-containing protein [Ktedonobacteraceae bacterium]
KENPRFWMLLDAFGNVSGIPVLLNTSFNLRDQPIICSPAQALDTFLESEIDFLVMGQHIVSHLVR